MTCMVSTYTDKTYELTVSFAAASCIWNKRKQTAMLLFSTDKGYTLVMGCYLQLRNPNMQVYLQHLLYSELVNQIVDYSYMCIL